MGKISSARLVKSDNKKEQILYKTKYKYGDEEELSEEDMNNIGEENIENLACGIVVTLGR